jgi:site-specific recombinase XerD
MKQKPSSRRKRGSAKSVLRLPDLEHAKAAVLNSLNSMDAKRGYRHAIDEFVDWYCSEPRLTVKAVWHIVKESAKSIGVAKLAPHDLRRTCARLCHASGGELEQIQFLLGRVSVQTTERYLGCKQRIRSAVNDRIGIGPNP